MAWGSGNRFLQPKYLKTGGVYDNHATCSMRQEGGGGLGQAAKPRPRGCGPLPLPRCKATRIFGGLDNLEKSMGSQSLILSPYIFPSFGACVLAVVPAQPHHRNSLQPSSHTQKTETILFYTRSALAKPTQFHRQGKRSDHDVFLHCVIETTTVASIHA